MATRKKLQAMRAVDEPGVYALRDPRNGLVRYVGSTRNISARFVQHRCSSERTAGARRKWVLDLRSAGFEPELVVLERHATYDKTALVDAEAAWIQAYRWLDEADLNKHFATGNRSAYARVQAENRALRAEVEMLRALLKARETT